MKLVSYGRREIILFASVFGAATLLTLILYAPVAVLPASALVFTLAFFRDPARLIPEAPGLVVAPADGRVVAIEHADEPQFLQRRVLVVRIRLSIFNVHINRAPAAGRVAMTSYRPGRFLNVLRGERAARENESNLIGFSPTTDNAAPLAVRQISGAIARRIVCAVSEDDVVTRGEKIGMIKFGSMTELYIPADAPFDLEVAVGQNVRAGTTVIGKFTQ